MITPLFLMYFPVFGAHISVAKIRCFDLKRGDSFNKMDCFVADSGYKKSAKACFEELRTML